MRLIRTKFGLSCIKQLTVRQAAVMAWRVVNEPGHVLRSLLRVPNDRTRAGVTDRRQPSSMRCTASRNLAAVWNESAELRSAMTLSGAKTVAKKIASEHRLA